MEIELHEFDVVYDFHDLANVEEGLDLEDVGIFVFALENLTVGHELLELLMLLSGFQTEVLEVYFARVSVARIEVVDYAEIMLVIFVIDRNLGDASYFVENGFVEL